jgi:hypothetical protein
LAIAVIGGLTFSTVLTLFFVPILYTVFEERFKRTIKGDEDTLSEIETMPNQIDPQASQPASEDTPTARK